MILLELILDLVDTGTHDVQQIMVTSAPVGASISGDFIEPSAAIGILAIVYTLIESDTLDYYLFIPRSLGQQRASAIFECIPSGTYNVSLFSVEESGLPFSRAATRVKTLVVYQQSSIDCVGE